MSGYVALYCRISKDKRGRAEGVEAQEKWGRTYAARTWPGVRVEVFADNHASAADPDAERPAFERLREAIIGGEVAHLWSVEQTRLERDEVRWFGLAAELDDAGIAELHTDRDGIVRVRDEVAGIKAVLSAGEVRRLRKRVNDTLAEKAAKGEPPGGKSFGYRRALTPEGVKTLEHDAATAPAARWMADAVLAGWSLASIVRKLVADDVPTVRGGAWSTQGVQSILRSPTLAGLRVYRGEVVGPGNWTGILDVQTWRHVVAVLSNPTTVTRSDGKQHHVSRRRRPGRRYLLTGGIARCGVCKAPLTAQDRRGRRSERVGAAYLCHSNSGGRNCVGIGAAGLEQYVEDWLLARLSNPRFVAQWTETDDTERRQAAQDRLVAIEAQEVELGALWGRREITTATWEAARGSLADERATAEAELAAIPVPDHLDLAAVGQAWHKGLTLDEKRQTVARLIESVTIRRAKPGTRRFDAGRVRIKLRSTRR